MRFIYSFIITIAITGCSFFAPYHVEVQQGNLVTQEMISEVELGMTKDQVKFLLGTPVLDSAFLESEWIYYYQSQIGDQPATYQDIKLVFAEDTLTEIIGTPKLSEQDL